MSQSLPSCSTFKMVTLRQFIDVLNIKTEPFESSALCRHFVETEVCLSDIISRRIDLNPSSPNTTTYRFIVFSTLQSYSGIPTKSIVSVSPYWICSIWETINQQILSIYSVT